MIITTLRLRNIKSFAEAELRFRNGINIIAGRNGAGKSTIIESVGLALFDAWPRKFKEGNARSGFIRYGEREGAIEVELQRGGERYTVRCDLASRKRKGSESIDYERAILDANGAEIASSAGRKKEFQDDIRRLILGEGRIDDENLFRDIIGTEQGGFDEPFTRNETERRGLFEKILGIEDFQDFDKQFSAFAKWQGMQAKELGIRFDERAGIPAELSTAELLLTEREQALTTATVALAQAATRAAEARSVVDALSNLRDELQRAQAEKNRVQEKLKGELEAEVKARGLLEEATAAAAALIAALPGYTSFISAEQQLVELRTAARQRDAAREQLASLTTQYEKRNAGLAAQREAVQQEQIKTVEAIQNAVSDMVSRDVRIGVLREQFAALDVRHQSIDAQAHLAGELRSYVQDLSTVQKMLLDAGSTMLGLSTTFDDLTKRIAEAGFEAVFLPALHKESEILFERFTQTVEQSAEITALSAMYAEAQLLEKRLLKEAKDARDAVSTVKEQGVSERKQRDEKALALKELRTKEAELIDKEQLLGAELDQLRSDWDAALTKLTTILAAHSDLDDRIAALEQDLEQHRHAHETYLAQKGAAELLERRKQAVADVEHGIARTRDELLQVEQRLEQLGTKVSEPEYEIAKQAHDAAAIVEKSALADHGRIAALVGEQRTAVDKLRTEYAEYLKLEKRLAYARAESAFANDVHQHVVRELAKNVGASIVNTLSSFAAELYQRLAPEQGLRLHWDAQTYAVELRGAGGVVRGRELSGGQLMGVSLAVKLALIKWYSQCRIGFLDEPTTHLDKETRLHLADVIQHLEDLTGEADPWFDQLFIISHEESFSGAGYRIELERHPDAGSRIVSGE